MPRPLTSEQTLTSGSPRDSKSFQQGNYYYAYQTEIPKIGFSALENDSQQSLVSDQERSSQCNNEVSVQKLYNQVSIANANIAELAKTTVEITFKWKEMRSFEKNLIDPILKDVKESYDRGTNDWIGFDANEFRRLSATCLTPEVYKTAALKLEEAIKLKRDLKIVDMLSCRELADITQMVDSGKSKAEIAALSAFDRRQYMVEDNRAMLLYYTAKHEEQFIFLRNLKTYLFQLRKFERAITELKQQLLVLRNLTKAPFDSPALIEWRNARIADYEALLEAENQKQLAAPLVSKLIEIEKGENILEKANRVGRRFAIASIFLQAALVVAKIYNWF